MTIVYVTMNFLSVTTKSHRKVCTLRVADDLIYIAPVLQRLVGVGLDVQVGQFRELLSSRAILQVLRQVVEPVLVLASDVVQLHQSFGETIGCRVDLVVLFATTCSRREPTISTCRLLRHRRRPSLNRWWSCEQCRLRTSYRP